MSELKVNFSHYEKQGIDLVLTDTLDGQFAAHFIRRDTGKTLTIVNLPRNLTVKDNRRV